MIGWREREIELARDWLEAKRTKDPKTSSSSHFSHTLYLSFTHRYTHTLFRTHTQSHLSLPLLLKSHPKVAINYISLSQELLPQRSLFLSHSFSLAMAVFLLNLPYSHSYTVHTPAHTRTPSHTITLGTPAPTLCQYLSFFKLSRSDQQKISEQCRWPRRTKTAKKTVFHHV